MEIIDDVSNGPVDGMLIDTRLLMEIFLWELFFCNGEGSNEHLKDDLPLPLGNDDNGDDHSPPVRQWW